MRLVQGAQRAGGAAAAPGERRHYEADSRQPPSSAEAWRTGLLQSMVFQVLQGQQGRRTH